MKYVADLHVHSRFSRACSNQLALPAIGRWAKLKGIRLMGTGDLTHPIWFHEIARELEEVAPGLYRLKNDPSSPYFLLGTETSHIFSQGGRKRSVHLLLYVPSLQVAEKINQTLSRHGSLSSDGRPIFGWSVREFLETVLAIDPQTLVVPAHVWTPWFGIYGANGGFDSLNEAFGNLADRIYAIETGMSSDPAMNWRIAELDDRRIISFSDAHSLPKIGREMTVFEFADLEKEGYSAFYHALRGKDTQNFVHSTIEFFPEEGKYHYTGHRNCGVCQSPEETAKRGLTCSVCGRRLTVGVMARVEELASRSAGFVPKERPPYRMFVPLGEIIAVALGMGVTSERVQDEYQKLVVRFDGELEVLSVTKKEELQKVTTPRVAEGIRRVREGRVKIAPGYDGVFGRVSIWEEATEAPEAKTEQMSLFGG